MDMINIETFSTEFLGIVFTSEWFDPLLTIQIILSPAAFFVLRKAKGRTLKKEPISSSCLGLENHDNR